MLESEQLINNKCACLHSCNANANAKAANQSVASEFEYLCLQVENSCSVAYCCDGDYEYADVRKTTKGKGYTSIEIDRSIIGTEHQHFDTACHSEIANEQEDQDMFANPGADFVLEFSGFISYDYSLDIFPFRTAGLIMFSNILDLPRNENELRSNDSLVH